jgi:hypothetical protein
MIAALRTRRSLPYILAFVLTVFASAHFGMSRNSLLYWCWLPLLIYACYSYGHSRGYAKGEFRGKEMARDQVFGFIHYFDDDDVGRWSIHPRGLSNEQMANREDVLVSGEAEWDEDGYCMRPNDDDFAEAARKLLELYNSKIEPK